MRQTRSVAQSYNIAHATCTELHGFDILAQGRAGVLRCALLQFALYI
jgi:hypothetical protein